MNPDTPEFRALAAAQQVEHGLGALAFLCEGTSDSARRAQTVLTARTKALLTQLSAEVEALTNANGYYTTLTTLIHVRQGVWEILRDFLTDIPTRLEKGDLKALFAGAAKKKTTKKKPAKAAVHRAKVRAGVS